MKTTLYIDEKLLARAMELTGLTNKSEVVNFGLQALIAKESAKRLVKRD